MATFLSSRHCPSNSSEEAWIRLTSLILISVGRLELAKVAGILYFIQTKASSLVWDICKNIIFKEKTISKYSKNKHANTYRNVPSKTEAWDYQINVHNVSQTLHIQIGAARKSSQCAQMLWQTATTKRLQQQQRL